MSTVTLPTNFLEKKRPRVIRESEVVLKSLFNLTSAKLDQGCSNMSLHFFTSYNTTRSIIVGGFLGYPQPGGGAHPPLPSEGDLGEVLGSWA